jgi:ribosomal protein L37AE/L43A
VDVNQLRPGASYKSLIDKRTHPIDELVTRFGHIPQELLSRRACPTCGSVEETLELEKDHMRIVRCRECDLVFVNPTFDQGTTSRSTPHRHTRTSSGTSGSTVMTTA